MWPFSRKAVARPSSNELHSLANNIARNMLARYDAAQTTDDNSRHWANADGLSAAAANSPGVRTKLRNRARYEYANNCFANGMVRTVAYHCIGTGPRLQVDTGNDAVDEQIEKAWDRWAKRVRLADKLRTMRQAKCRDGEAFAMFTTNRNIQGPIQLDLRLIEAEQVADPFASLPDDRSIDGIDYDENGDAVRYHVLKDHPGGTVGRGLGLQSDPIPADMMIHLFRADRPGQVRGIPEITPALPLYAILRRYTLATLSAAEIAAIFAIVVKTSGSVDVEAMEAWQTFAVERNAMTTLPAGYDIGQIKAEHPTQAYEAFQKAIIREIARCLSMPFGIAAGDASSYNYSSFRADDQLWVNEIEIERDYWSIACLDRVLEEFRKEATASGAFPQVDDLNHSWFWDERQGVDVEKEANAAIKLRNAGLLLEADYFASQGKDWRKQHRGRRREQDSRDMSRLPVNEPLPMQPQDPKAASDAADPEPQEAA